MKTFKFNGQELSYFSHAYNNTSKNMRTVEVPIMRAAIERTRQHNPRALILEVGNVLSHYSLIDWPVIDIRERGQNVINADIMKWKTKDVFDLIISISTIEHIGFGNHYTEPTTPLKVLAHLRQFLMPSGRIIATAPLKYNPALDQQIKAGTLGADRLWFMRRISDTNEWLECSRDEAFIMPYRQGMHRWGGGMVIMMCRGRGDDR